jgi:hypothetical protein
MAIRSVFRLGGEIVNIIVDGNNLMFLNDEGTITTVEGLRISKGGAMEEFPDLEGNEDWRKITLERLKEKLLEEAQEVFEAYGQEDKTNLKEEMADVIEVIDAMLFHNKKVPLNHYYCLDKQNQYYCMNALSHLNLLCLH